MEKIKKSVEKMWKEYLESKEEIVQNTDQTYTSWYFCDNEKSANDLAELVKKGIKRATTSLHCFYEVEGESLPKIGELSIITDWNGEAQGIIETTKVTVMPFKEVSSEFAFREGEGDKSLEYWKKVHIHFFTKELKEINMEFSEDMLVVCEEFEVVYK
ncbi:ASCH domain-containing protein [Clostridium oryzae]|uniref:ASCH domain protein n=1 Tax=Clostridium oryzae TaxID=1450648 RepID=A0A1V4ID22_9CLOT|nr:ASCH domain-containing protein [Clostridium oryzae]OPJ57829.1 ASCH domain protein [Clostridium oryzae]